VRRVTEGCLPPLGYIWLILTAARLFLYPEGCFFTQSNEFMMFSEGPLMVIATVEQEVAEAKAVVATAEVGVFR